MPPVTTVLKPNPPAPRSAAALARTLAYAWGCRCLAVDPGEGSDLLILSSERELRRVTRWRRLDVDDARHAARLAAQLLYPGAACRVEGGRAAVAYVEIDGAWDRVAESRLHDDHVLALTLA